MRNSIWWTAGWLFFMSVHGGEHEAGLQAFTAQVQGVAHGIQCGLGAVNRYKDFHGSFADGVEQLGLARPQLAVGAR